MSQTRSVYYQKLVDQHMLGKLTRSSIGKYSINLNTAEQKLLQARILLKERKFAECLEFLDFESENVLLRGETYCLKATALNSLAKYEEAIIANIKAQTLCCEAEDRRGQFLALYNLSVDYGKLSLHYISEYYLGKAEEFAESESERSLLLRGQMIILESFSNNNKVLMEKLKIFVKKSESLNRLDHVDSMVIVSELLMKLEMINECRDLLSKLFKNIKKGILLDRLRLNVFCLEIISGFPQKNNHKYTSIEFKFKYELLSSIIDRDTKKRMYYWEKLQEIYPNQFLDFPRLSKNFEHNIFFLKATEKLLGNNAEFRFPRKLNKLEKLIYLLNQRPDGLDKSTIIEILWGLEKVEHIGSYNQRFHKLMERARLSGCDIKYLDNLYFLRDVSTNQ